jgi:hypothetical protein
LCLDPLHVSGVKRPSSGGTTLAVFGVSCVHKCLMPKTCRGSKHNKVIVKVKVY